MTVIVVVGSELDHDALTLTAALPGAVLSGADDLSAPGWLHRVGGPGPQYIVADGKRIDQEGIDAILVRRPYVAPEELRRIRSADRPYAAAEATALLRSWLAAAGCVVVNRPTATGLGGPAWLPMQWQAAALRAGITAPARADRPGAVCSVLVIGEQSVTDTEAAIPAARALARLAGVDLLEVCFEVHDDGFRLRGANPWPRIDTREAIKALAELLTARVARAAVR